MQEVGYPQQSWPRMLFNLAMYISIGIVAFFVITEHRAHLFGILPYLFLFSCPLMHLFMHHNHGGHGEHHHQDHSEESDDRSYQQKIQGGKP